ncbi:hypothetical protein ACFYWX_44565 [Streptomyces sp. NPDC002888]|uniref:hypothetical protein n=1 Tax=Streptomyces sp. NPDC002888 TaxID=3364668 RepID=UPI00368B22A8
MPSTPARRTAPSLAAQPSSRRYPAAVAGKVGAQHLPQRADNGGDMDLAVRVHAQDDLASNG